jgi:hypothetical protein
MERCTHTCTRRHEFGLESLHADSSCTRCGILLECQFVPSSRNLCIAGPREVRYAAARRYGRLHSWLNQKTTKTVNPAGCCTASSTSSTQISTVQGPAKIIRKAMNKNMEKFGDAKNKKENGLTPDMCLQCMKRCVLESERA